MTDGENTDHYSTEAAPPTGRRSSSGSARRTPMAPRRKLLLFLGLGALALVLLIGGGAFTAYSETSEFCPTCHEMAPYYDAWQQGRHHGHAECVDCHIDSGVVAHIAHKPSELVELWDHFFTDYRFPNYEVDVPNNRCVRCHPAVSIKTTSRFSHKLHETKAQCHECHNTTGHEVPLASLRDAGILKDGATMPQAPNGLQPSTIPGHIEVVCQECHPQAKMKCTACHTAPHESRGECDGCHRPGEKFLFVHPVSNADCSKCHKLPAKHRAVTGACATCHTQAGKSWAFTHPASTACASCHTPPAKHYGAACAGCHKPGVPFSRAVFRHPGNTGEHSYRSFACAKCHPKGFGSSSCTCHGGRAPRGD